MNDNKGKDQKFVIYGILTLVVVLFFAYQVVSMFINSSHQTEDKNKQLEQFYQYEIDKQNKSNNN